MSILDDRNQPILIHFHLIKESGKENNLYVLKATFSLATCTDLYA